MRGLGLVLFLTLALCFAAVSARASSDLTLRSCGTLATGWHVSATPDVLCSTARPVVRGFVDGGIRCRSECTVRRFACKRHLYRDGQFVRCVRGDRVVVGLSRPY